MKSIILIIPYFGNWPIWFDAFLISIKGNPTVDWLCPTNCQIPKNCPKNIKFIEQDLSRLNISVNDIVSANVPLTPRKFCDLKPAYGDIFKEEVKDYDFWGICDMDIIWGDIRAFITDDLLTKYDIISSRKHAISGHFNLFRNSSKLNNLYKLVPNYRELFEKDRFMWFDEHVLTAYLKNNSINNSINVYWPSIILNQENGVDSHQEYYLDKWLWKNGKIIDIHTNKEVIYLHFINWKRTMKFSQIKYTDFPEEFYISYNGMHFNSNSNIIHLLNGFKNIFNGYWIKEKRRKQKLKIKNFIKRIKSRF